jgi:hypothetical protein
MGPSKVLSCAFYVSATGRRPVRDWLLGLSDADRKTIGEDIATLEYCWPIGKPKCSAIQGVTGLYEVRSNIFFRADSTGNVRHCWKPDGAPARLRQEDAENAFQGTAFDTFTDEGSLGT